MPHADSRFRELDKIAQGHFLEDLEGRLEESIAKHRELSWAFVGSSLILAITGLSAGILVSEALSQAWPQFLRAVQVIVFGLAIISVAPAMNSLLRRLRYARELAEVHANLSRLEKELAAKSQESGRGE